MSQKKGKKKGRRKDDDWEDDVANELEEITISETDDLHVSKNETNKKKKKKSRGKEVIISDEENDNVLTRESSFGLLDVQDIENNDKNVDSDTNEEKNEGKEEGKKEGKKEKRTKKEKLVTETKEETEQVGKDNDTNGTLEVVNDKQEVDGNSSDTDEVNLKKLKKKAKKDKAKKEVEEDVNLEEDSSMKTSAQKRAEKKERDKKKKEAQKKRAKDTKSNKNENSEHLEAEIVKGVEEVVEENIERTDHQNEEHVEVGVRLEEGVGEVTLEHDDDDDDDDEKDGGDEKKKKKKKKKKTKDEEAPKTKKPGKGVIKQMQEALEKAKLEQERLSQEEEAKQKALEEAENKRLEKLQLEKERKERQKLKEKERKQRLKQEGKLLTKAQKQQRAQAEVMLQAMREKGIEIPSRTSNSTYQTDVKKPIRYGKKKTKQPQEKSEAEQEEIVEETTIQVDDDKESKVEILEEEEEEENIEVDEDVDDVKDTWDDDDEETLKKHHATTKQKDIEMTEDDDDEEEEEETSDEEDEESGKEGDTSEEETESDSKTESSEDESLSKEEREFKRAKARIAKRREKAEVMRSKDKLRSPVICVMGHVDTGKTKILDKIRHTNVQDGEAGGITQQIGATNVPKDAVMQQTKMIKDFASFEMNVPALLIIDTPGHESFSNLRSRGSNLCDMAILVVDIMHGLEPQTIESINLLRTKKTPFVVALNKVDRLFEWKRGPNSSIIDTLKKQNRNTKQEFEERLNQIIGEFAQEGLNAVLFNKNVDTKSYISLVPTSAHTGDGMGDLIALIVKLCQTKLAHRISFSEELQCTVLEVKAITGLGTTIDVILTNGRLLESQTVVLGGIEGPIVTQIRSLLMPEPLRELRVKNQYAIFKEIEAAQGVKITGKELDKALAGSPLFVAYQEDEIEVLKREVAHIVQQSLKSIKVSERGVCVQASTLGSLEALLEFLKTSKIPYCSVSVGPVHKKDVMKASVMLEHDEKFAVILAFDVKVEREAQELADNLSVTIFTADIIYHLFDKFTKFTEDLKQKKRDQFKHIAIFPCKLRILSEHIYNNRDPIVVGVSVEAGIVKEGTPVCVPSKEFIEIGIVTGIEANHKQLEKATKGMEVCLKIEPIPGEPPKLYGRHFDYTDPIISKISRESIDAVKEYFRDDLQKTDWQLMIELKKLLKII